MSKEYTNKEITIKWQLRLCLHTAIRVRSLPYVYNIYNPKASPKIVIENASTDNLKRQISQCTSGALSYCENKNDE